MATGTGLAAGVPAASSVELALGLLDLAATAPRCCGPWPWWPEPYLLVECAELMQHAHEVGSELVTFDRLRLPSLEALRGALPLVDRGIDPSAAPAQPRGTQAPADAAAIEAEVDRQVDRVLRLLRRKITESDLTQTAIQDRLGWGRSYISQLFSRAKGLRVDQVLSILGVLDIGEEFVRYSRQVPRRSIPRLSRHRSASAP